MADDVQFMEFLGERFALRPKFNSRLFLKFARAAADGVDSESAEGMAIIDKMLERVLRPEDMERFDEVCDRECPDFEALMRFIMGSVAKISGRPTGQPSDSSDGLTTTTTSSPADSSSLVITDLEARGRPDLALLVTRTQESRASA